VTPDLSTLGKAIANGFPLAVLCGRGDVLDRFNTSPNGNVLFGGTFNGHALSVAAALATIEILEQDGGAVHRHIGRLGQRMHSGLQQIVTELGLPARPASFGSVFVCYFTEQEIRSFDDCLMSDPGLYIGFHRGMIERGFFMLPMNLKRNHVMAAHTESDVDLTLEAAAEVLSELASISPRQVGSQDALYPGAMPETRL